MGCGFFGGNIFPTTQKRFPEGRLLCNGPDACVGGLGILEFRDSSDYLDCRCLWMVLNERFCALGFCAHQVSQTITFGLMVIYYIFSLFCRFSGQNRGSGACNLTEIHGAGSICCQQACSESHFELASESNVCCSGNSSCMVTTFSVQSTAPIPSLSSLSCAGEDSCAMAVVPSLSGDLKCLGTRACGGSTLAFYGKTHAITCGGASACASGIWKFVPSDPCPKNQNALRFRVSKGDKLME